MLSITTTWKTIRLDVGAYEVYNMSINAGPKKFGFFLKGDKNDRWSRYETAYCCY